MDGPPAVDELSVGGEGSFERQTEAGPTAGAGEPTAFRLSSQLVTLSGETNARAESLSALRSHLLAQHVSERRRGIVFCGASEGVGCTYLSCNMAVAMAQAGVRTLLIDANLHNPAVQDYFAPDRPTSGLAQYLLGETASPAEIVFDEVLPNLSLILAGGEADNAAELLASAPFKELVGKSMRDFDLTVVDTPPANIFADARRIASMMHYALIVARKDVTFVSDIRNLAQELVADRAEVLGTFLNDY